MQTARVFRGDKRERDTRAHKTDNAFDAIGEINPGCEVFILTFGQFSFIDAVSAIIKKIGPSEVVISTWTAGNADLSIAAEMMMRAEITDLRMLVDRSFLTRQPAYCKKMVDLFGVGCIRTWRSHAKFALIRGGDYRIVMRTSMNMNTNPRIENLEISDDPLMYEFFEQIVDEHFERQGTDVFDGELPMLENVKFSDQPKIMMGTVKLG